MEKEPHNSQVVEKIIPIRIENYCSIKFIARPISRRGCRGAEWPPLLLALLLRGADPAAPPGSVIDSTNIVNETVPGFIDYQGGCEGGGGGCGRRGYW